MKNLKPNKNSKIKQLNFGVKNFFKKAVNKVKSFFKKFLGIVKKYKYISLSAVLVLGILFTGLIIYYLKAPGISYDVLSPESQLCGKVENPKKLRIRFGSVSDSVANIKLVNKKINDGIKMTPAFRGTWRWEGDRNLVFTPEKNWPANKKFSVVMDDKIFAEDANIKDMSFDFKTPDFTADIKEIKFYRNPVNIKEQKIVATVCFSHPVDTKTFTENVSVDNLKLDVSYNDTLTEAYIHSESVEIKKSEYSLDLLVGNGIKTVLGDEPLKEEKKREVTVPSISTFFKLDEWKTKIVKNPKNNNQPEQTLIVNFTAPVKNDDLKDNITAYLLPKHYSFDSNDKGKNRVMYWSNPEEITDDVISKSEKLKLAALPVAREYTTLHSFKYDVTYPENRYIFVKINKGIKSEGGYLLSNNYVEIMPVPNYPKEVSITGDGAVLSLSGDKKLSIATRGVESVKIEIARLMSGQINHLITQTNGDFKDPYFDNYGFNKDNITEQFTEIKKFNYKHPKEANYATLDLSKYLKSKQGIYFIKAQGYNSYTKEETGPKDERLILMTDLGLLVKSNKDGTREVFVISLKEGLPVFDVKVDIIAKNGKAVYSKYTDFNGYVKFPKMDFKYNDPKKPIAYIASKGNDISFLPFNRYDRKLNYSKFEVGGEFTSSTSDKGLKAFLFTDRGIYRPGEEVKFGGIVKGESWYSLENLPLEFSIKDPSGSEIYNNKFKLSYSGIFEESFKSLYTSKTGDYKADLYLAKPNDKSEYLGSETFKVEEFEPDKLRIKTKLISKNKFEGWILPQDVKASVDLKNLFGKPAMNRKIEADINLEPKTFYFKKYKDYHFNDPYRDDENNVLKNIKEALPKEETDSNGFAEYDLKLDRFEAGTYQLTFTAEGFEQNGGRSVVSQSKTLISPMEYLIGYKTDGDLSYIKKNSNRSIEFLAINPDLKQISLENLQLEIYSKQYVSSLVKQKDGTYAYQSVVKENKIASRKYSVLKKGAAYNLKTDNPGDYYILIKDNSNNKKLSRVDYSVVGNKNLSFALEKNSELKIKLNKSEYMPGETIELQITSPYSGAGLITIEKDKVYTRRWFKTDSTSSTHFIQVPDDIKGNGYVNVAFIRGLNSKEIYVSPLSYAVKPFTVNKEKYSIDVDLDAPGLVKPGDEIKIGYKTSKPAKLILFAVDEGILQFADYKTPNPLEYFFRKKALEVNTAQIVDLLLPEFSVIKNVAGIGGGYFDEANSALERNINPFKRKTLKPAVYWSGIITSENYYKYTSFKVPDYFNGEYRIMAVAVNEEAFGSNDIRSVSRGPFVISPNVPFHAAPGDEFEVSVGISNNVKGSGKNAKVKVSLDLSKHFEIKGDKEKITNIAEDSEGKVKFKVKVREILGNASINFKANLENGKADTLVSYQTNLSIRPKTPYKTEMKMGLSDEKSFEIDDYNKNLYDEFAKRKVSVSNNPALFIKSMMAFLEKYPHGCSEQIVSAVFPFLKLAKHNDKYINKNDFMKSYDSVVSKLINRQQPNGGFSLWPNSHRIDDYVSLYIMDFLLEAKNQGYPVSQKMLSKGMNWIKGKVSSENKGIYNARKKAYGIYILTKYGYVTGSFLSKLTNYLENNYEKQWEKDLIGVYMAASYKLLKNDAKANSIISKYNISDNINIENENIYFYDSENINDVKYLSIIARHFPNKFKLMDKNIILDIIKSLKNNNYNTLYASYVILTLSDFMDKTKVLDDGINITEIIDGKSKEIALKKDIYPVGSFSKNSEKIKVESKNISDLGLFYYTLTAGFEKKVNENESEGIEVSKEFTNLDGDSISSINIGDEIIVNINIRAKGDNRVLKNIAITDLIPGGFDIIRDNDEMDDGCDYYEFREDRAVFYMSVDTNVKTISYKLKAISVGTFNVPAVYTASMYDRSIFGSGEEFEIDVNDAD